MQEKIRKQSETVRKSLQIRFFYDNEKFLHRAFRPCFIYNVSDTFFASEYAQKQIAVVSGMAKELDSYAHTACLNAGS